MADVNVFYNCLRQLFPNAKLFTDTDTLCVGIATGLNEKDVYEQLCEKAVRLNNGTEVAAASLFDFSNYLRDHPCHFFHQQKGSWENEG